MGGQAAPYNRSLPDQGSATGLGLSIFNGMDWRMNCTWTLTITDISHRRHADQLVNGRSLDLTTRLAHGFGPDTSCPRPFSDASAQQNPRRRQRVHYDVFPAGQCARAPRCVGQYFHCLDNTLARLAPTRGHLCAYTGSRAKLLRPNHRTTRHFLLNPNAVPVPTVRYPAGTGVTTGN